MPNIGNTQQQIAYGASANDGTGDPLRTAFIKTDENFDNVWLAGPVGSNITIINNTVGVNNTNGNLILSPNGVGNVQFNRDAVPRLNNTYNLGAANLTWRSLSVGTGGISATGNVSAGNLTTTGTVSATNIGNIASINLDGNASTVLYGNGVFAAVAGGGTYGDSNVNTLLAAWGSNTISTTGNITSGYLFGNGSQLTGLPATYGNSNVATFLASFGSNAISTSGNITAGYFVGNGSTLTSITAANVTGTVANATYATSAGSATTATSATTAATVTTNAQPNITSVGTLSSISVTGNVTGGDVLTGGVVSATGNVTGGNLLTAGLISATSTITSASDITGGNVLTGGVVSATGNITGGNILTGGLVSATGNVSGNFFIGNGSQLTGIAASYGNANVVANLVALGTNPVSTTGNVSAGYFIGNGSQLTGITSSSYGDSNVTVLLAALGSNIISGTGNVTTTANIAGNYILGNGSQLTGLPATYGNANVVANLAALGSNPVSTTGNVTAGYVIGNGSTLTNLTGANVSGTVANATYAVSAGSATTANTAATVTTAAQPNITSVGILSSASVSGNVTSGNVSIVGGTLAFANASIVQTNPLDLAITGAYQITVKPAGGSYQWTFGNDGALTGTTGLGVTGYVSAGGNVIGGNIRTAGLVTATGNITGGNLLTAGVISSTGTVTGSSLLGSVASASGNITGGNVLTGGLISATGNINGGNLTLANGQISVTYTPSSITGVAITAQGANTNGGTGYFDFLKATNQSGGATNPNKSFRLNSTGGFEIVNSAYTATLFSIADNGNTIVQGNLQVTGNLTYVNTTNLSVTNALITLANAATTPSQANGGGIQLNGANANIIYTSGNDAWNMNKPLAVTGAITGTTTISAAGNITGGNVLTAGLVSATGNVTGNYVLGNGALLTGVITSVANINSGTSNVTVVSSGGNITVGVGGTSNVAVFATTGEYVTGVVSASGNVTGGNVLTGGIISSTGNITGGNLSGTSIAGTLTTAAQTNITSVGTLGALTVTANVTGGNVLTAGIMSSTGNATHGNILTAGLVSATANVTGGNITTAGLISATGNITGSNISATNHTGTTVSVTGNVTAGNVINTGISSVTGNITAGNVLTGGVVSATGNITTANSFVGNLVGTTVSVTGNVTAGNVIVNGQPTTYGYVNPGYVNVGLNTTISGIGAGSTFIYDTVLKNNGTAVTYNTGTGVFTLTAGVTYNLMATGSWGTFSDTSGGYIVYSWVDATTNTRLDTTGDSDGVAEPINRNVNEFNATAAELIYTPVTNQTVKVYVVAAGGTASLRGGIGSKAIVTQLNPSIAVQATATGTINNQYISAGRTSDQSGVGANTDLIWNQTVANNTVSLNTSTGVFQLTAGVTYNLTANPQWNNWSVATGYVSYQWVDATTNAALDSSGVTNGTAVGPSSPQSYNQVTSLIYTPSTNQTVKVRVIGGGTATMTGGYGSWVTITQINNAFALNALNTMSTTGNVSVGGNLTTTGGIRKNARELTTTTTLTVADASGFIEFNSGPYTVTLPDPTQAANSGIGYRFWQNTISNITLSTPAGGFYGPSGNSGASTKVLAQATTQYWDVWSDGYNWAVFGIKIA